MAKKNEVIDWSKEIAQAEAALGIMKYVPVSQNPLCANADYIYPGCDNVNLEADGYCQRCDRYHWKVFFGKMHKGPYGREDQGCMSFGDDNCSDFAAGNLMFAGTPGSAVYDARPFEKEFTVDDGLLKGPSIPLGKYVDPAHEGPGLEQPKQRPAPAETPDTKQISLEYTRKHMSK